MVKEAMFKLLLLFSLCLLTSCTTTDKDDQIVPELEQPESHDIIQQVQTNIRDINNFTLTSESKQTVSKGDLNQEIISRNSHTLYNISPVTYHQKIVTNTSQSQSSRTETSSGEQYVTEDGAYLLKNSTDIWMEIPLELTQEVIDFQNPHLDPNSYLELMEENKEMIEIEETEEYYILGIEGEGPELRDMVMQLYHISNLANEQQSIEIMNHMDITSIQYDLYINKGTYLLDRAEITIDLITMFEGDSVSIDMNVDTNIIDYNDTEVIQIPTDIINNAEEYRLELNE
ncbi:DUF6612 family protein [Alkalicoccobacillus murimartini]|uniref:Outer membrane biogenesis lipoprotein LolB n=1 Tax=Alkalicoccobacillus murimartini TaxID=171685 RepID=A0ABT9YFR1_9BACI|nr:DUF6612 family protein [Alkalicoccobacillus murimartini]MDQ0206052.1 outer membrane biogenesis lipoprotein LolB [Alkalicoccobacillus murimartini]